MKEAPAPQKVMGSEDAENIGLFPSKDKNQDLKLPQNSNHINADKPIEHLGKLNMDESVEEISEELNEKGSYQPPDRQDKSSRGRSRLPEGEIRRDRYRYDVTDRRYRYDYYDNRSYSE